MAAVPRPGIILAPSPPLTMGLGAWVLSRFWRAPYIYNVQEIYPDIAIRLGVVRARWLIRLLVQLENLVYRKASRVTVIAPRMLSNLLRKGVPLEKVAVIPNFVDIAKFCPLPRDNDFSRKHNLHGKFVVNYAGNLGPTQGLEGFIEAATRLQTQTNIHFVMMGDGILRETLRSDVVRRQLPNFSFLPYQSYELMPQVYASADVCLECAVIRRMVKGLDLDVEVAVLPTVREPDGLAMSSRNAYLDPEQRKKAACLYRALIASGELVRAGVRDPEKVKQKARAVVAREKGVEIDYVEIVGPETVVPLDPVRMPAVILIAARVGTTRLIDNLLVQ